MTPATISGSGNLTPMTMAIIALRLNKLPMLGFPPHLFVLKDGRTVCTYGRRTAPYGERACISNDGTTWDIAHEIILRDDNAGYDLGYPASIETSPGEILSVYYQKPALDPTDKHKYKVGIYATRWRAADVCA